MFRLYDWRCEECGTVREALLSFPQASLPERQADLYCECCGAAEVHVRLISQTQKYLGDRPLAPQVYGGKFDTMGMRQVPILQDPFDKEPVASGKDYKEWFHTKEYQETKQAQKAILKENAAKKRRAQAITAGQPVNMREWKLPGDPKVSA